jgi:ATP-dependent RNA helicase DBP3
LQKLGELVDLDCFTELIRQVRSGKTLAFGLPAITHLRSLPSATNSEKKKKRAKGPVGVLVLAPTRELAMQTHEHLETLAKLSGFTAVCVYGGVPKPPQVEAIQKGARVVVGTPGRILDLCNDETLDLSQVGYLVLDEADRMLDSGFENDVRNIIAKCRSNASTEALPRQTVMFSATWPASVRRLAADFMINPVKILVGSDDLTASASVHQSVIVLEDGRMKEQKLLQTLKENGWMSGGKGRRESGDKVLVFALYKKEASRIEAFLQRNGYSVSCLQGKPRSFECSLSCH